MGKTICFQVSAAPSQPPKTPKLTSGLPAKSARGPEGPGRLLTGLLGIVFFLYLFLLGIKGIGAGLKELAKDPETQAQINSLFDYTTNPFVGLAVGILITVAFQSSSFTTSFLISLIGPAFTFSQAIPAIMGANIGTSITNTLASLSHLTNRREFRSAFAAAIVHDIFNLLTVLIFLPLELLFGLLSRASIWCAQLFPFPEEMEKSTDLIGQITKPLIGAFAEFLREHFALGTDAAGIAIAAGSIILMFIALIMLVKTLKTLILNKVENLFGRYIFANIALTFCVGIIVTVMVQSSSITTSLIIPFVGAGLLSLNQVFPYMVGANIGTTITGLIAAAVKGTSGALTVGFAHLLFNVFGAAIFLPLRSIPVNSARRLSFAISRRKWLAFVYILGVFVVAPAMCIFIFSFFDDLGILGG